TEIVWHRAEPRVSMDVSGASLEQIHASLQLAWDRGFEAVQLQNYIKPSSTTPETVIVVRDLPQFRRPDANFHKSKRMSTNLTAGLSGLSFVPIGAGMLIDEEER